MRWLASSAALIVGALIWPLPASAQVRLSIDEGHVTLNATNATMSQILAEWARVGQTKIVNGDRVPGNVVALELSDVSEADALEIILRSVSGYVLAPRPEPVRHASRYDRILILPTSSPVRAQTAPAAASPIPLPRPQFSPPPTRENDPSEAAPAAATPLPPAARPPGFNVFPQPQQPATPPPSAPASSPTVPPGVSVPGMVPAPPAQPAPPAGAPTTPRR